MTRAFIRAITALLLCITAGACSKDEVIPAALLPEIIFSVDDHTYSTLPGRDIVVAPLFRNLDGGMVRWLMNGEEIAQGPILTFSASDEGSYYVTVEATNEAGTSRGDIRINVLPPSVPVIYMRVPQEGYRVKAGTTLTLEPMLLNTDAADYEIIWSIDGKEVARGVSAYTFTPSKAGTYHFDIAASNVDGSSSLSFTVVATEGNAGLLYFPGLSYRYPSGVRYTFAGRAVSLWTVAQGFTPSAYSWEIDGEPQVATGRVMTFTPSRPGSYNVTVNTPEGICASTTVVCVESDEASCRRLSATGSGITVLEYTPAPGQFINEYSQAAIADAAGACQWAEQTMARGEAVSLGAFGGCIIVGFDHSVPAGAADWDFAIGGNQFDNPHGASCEPGVVWVMQDVNGNGLPDDEWYELKGSEWDASSPTGDYTVTYYRPTTSSLPVMWSDLDGGEGSVAYMGASHSQPSYYPSWVNERAYTLHGRLLPAHHSQDIVTGFWSNAPYDWGYADNTGSDLVSSTAGTGGDPGVSLTGFSIANAVLADGSPIRLAYIDFVMIQSAVLGQSGHLGEISTEVTSIRAR